MCCLRYEHEFYVESRRRFPKEGRIVRTTIGDEKVLSCNIFHETVTLRTAEGDTRVIPLADFKGEIEAAGGAVAFEQQADSDYVPFVDEHMTTETQEFMVARETTPMIDILVQPGNDIGVEIAQEVVETITVLYDVDLNPTPLVIQTILTSGEPVPPGEAVPPVAAGLPTESAAPVEGEMRRKRRRGRRGGRRLRGADGRNANARSGDGRNTDDNAPTADGTRSDDSDEDGPDEHGADSDDSNDFTTN